jgi:hypothetical protein
MNGGPIREKSCTFNCNPKSQITWAAFYSLTIPIHAIFFWPAPGFTQTHGLRVLRLAGAARRLLTAGISVTAGGPIFVNIYQPCFLISSIR